MPQFNPLKRNVDDEKDGHSIDGNYRE